MAPPSKAGGSVETRRTETLTYRVLGPDTAPLTVVLLHGYGAPGPDLVPLGPELEARWPALAERVRWVFPEALLPLPASGGAGRMWWEIDPAYWEALELADTAEFERLRTTPPAGLAAAREAVMSLLVGLRAEAPDTRLVVGGFSQGAMLATDVTLRLEPPPVALVVLSGTLIDANSWRRLAPGRQGLRVFQSHGRQDPVLPFRDAERLRDLFSTSGLSVDFLPFDGGHTIPLAAFLRVGALLADASSR